MKSEAERFDTEHPTLCPCIRWKGMFITAERDPTVPPARDDHFWCMYTQSCIGPDGGLVEPGECCSGSRACYGTGKV